MEDEPKQKPTLRLMNHHNLDDSIAFIEEMTGEKMTPEEVAELRQALGLEAGVGRNS